MSSPHTLHLHPHGTTLRLSIPMEQTTTDIVRCPACNAGNRLPPDQIGSSAAKCGKCKASLFPEKPNGPRVKPTRCAAPSAAPAIAFPGPLERRPQVRQVRQPLRHRSVALPRARMVTDDEFRGEGSQVAPAGVAVRLGPLVPELRRGDADDRAVRRESARARSGSARSTSTPTRGSPTGSAS